MNADAPEKISVLELLSQTYTMEIIYKIHKESGCTKTSLANGGADKTRMKRIKELIEYGIIMVDDNNRQYNSIQLYLTPTGQKIANLIEPFTNIEDLEKTES